MAEKIGLIAQLDLSQWTTAVNSYLGSIAKMQAATQAMAATVSSSFSGLNTNLMFSSNAGAISRSFGGLGKSATTAATAISHFQTNLQHLTRDVHEAVNALDVLASNFALVRMAASRTLSGTGAIAQLNSITTAANQAAFSLARLASTQTRIGGGRLSGGNILGTLGNIAGGIGSVVGQITGNIIKTVGSVLGGITKTVFSVLGGLGKTVASLLVGSIGGAFSFLGRSIMGIVGGITKGVLSAFQGMVSGIARLITSAIGSAFSLLGRTITGIVSGLAKTVFAAFQGLVRGILSIVSGLISGVVNAFASIARSVVGIVTGLVSSVANAFMSLAGSVLNIVGGMVSGIASAFTSLATGIFNIVGNLVSGIANAFSSLVGNILNIVGSIAKGVFSVFSSLLRTVVGVVSSLAKAVVGIFTSLAKSVVNVVTEMAKAVFNVISTLVKSVSSTLMSMGKSILDAYRDLGKQLTRIITVATVAVVGAVAFAGKKLSNWLADAIVSAAEFEKGMATIASVLRVTRAEVGPLADKIDELALDPMLVVSTDDAAAAVEQLARNGIEMADILNGAAEATILLANATGGTFTQSADIATMAMQMFNMKASEMNKIADISQGVVNNSRIELDDWALALGNGGAAAAVANVSLEDFATGIAATVNLYHSARQAGTGMTNFIERLVPLTEVAADEMRKLGLFTGLSQEKYEEIAQEIAETEDRIANLDPRLVHYDELVQAHTDHLDELKGQLVQGSNAFFDTEGNFKGLATASELLKNAMSQLSEEEVIEANRRIFGNDALETAIGFSRLGADAFNKLKADISIQGSAAEAAAVRTANLASRWENLQDIWEAIQRKSGAGFNDMLLKLVNRLTELTGANQDKVIAFFGRMAQLTERLVDAMMPWVERMLPTLITNLEAFASWLVEIALGGGKAQDWLDKMTPGFRTFINRTLDGINAVMQFGKQLWEFGKKAVEALTPVMDWIKENVELKDVLIAAALAIATSVVPGILRLIGVGLLAVKAVATIRKAWEEDWRGIRTTFTRIWEKIRGPLTDFVNNFLTGKWKDAWRDAVSVVGTLLGELEAAVPPFFKTFVNLMSDVLHGDWEGAWDNIVKIAMESFALIKRLLKDLEKPFTDFIVNVVWEAWKEIWPKIVEQARNAFEELKSFLRRLDTPFTDFAADILDGDWVSVWDTIRDEAKKAFERIKDYLAKLNTPFTRFLLDILEGRWYTAWRKVRGVVVEAFDTVIEQLARIGNPFTDFIVHIVRGEWFEAWDDFKEIVTIAFNGVKFALRELNLPFTNFILDILEGDWATAWRKVSNVARTAFALLKIALTDLRTPFTDFIVDVLEGDWSAAWIYVEDIARRAFNKIIDYLYGLRNPFTTFLADVLTGEWGKVWATMQATATGVLESIKQYLPSWGDAFISSLQDIINGRWTSAWDNAKLGVTLTLEEIKNFLPPWGDELATALQLILDGKWAEAWGHASNGAVLALEEIKTYTGPWGDSLITILQLMLQGKWGAAWAEASALAKDVFESIKIALKDMDTPFADFVVDILEGRWGEAWKTAYDFLFGEEGLLSKKLPDALRELDTPFTTFVADILEGKWGAAWIVARDAAILALEEIKIHTPPWGDAFITMIQDILAGRWASAWANAKLTAILALDEIKVYTPLWGDAFIGAVQAILEGKWKLAWDNARLGAILALDEIAKYTPLWGDVFITAVQAILVGRWDLAWELAKVGAIIALEEIKAHVPGWGDEFITTLQLIIDGRWKEVWARALGMANMAIDTIKLKIPELDGPILAFIEHIINGEWDTAWNTDFTDIVQQALDRIGPIIMIAFGGWVGIIGAVILSLSTFQDQIKAISENEDFPKWLRSAAVTTLAYAKASEALSVASGDFIRMLNELTDFNKQKEGNEWLIIIGQELELIFLSASNAFLAITALNKLMRGADTSEEIAKIAKNMARIEEISAGWKQGSTEPIISFAENIRDELNFLLDETDIVLMSITEKNELMKSLGLESVEKFTSAFLQSNTVEARARVSLFITDIILMAQAIKKGYYEAGSDTVNQYVGGLAAKYGLAEEAAENLSTVIIGSFNEGLSWEGVQIPENISKTLIDPLTNAVDPANQEGKKVGEAAVEGVTEGVNTAKPSSLKTLDEYIAEAYAALGILPPQATQVGADAVTGLDAGAEGEIPSSLEQWLQYRKELEDSVRPLVEGLTTTGTEAVTGLDAGAWAETPSSIEQWEAYKNALLAGVAPLVPDATAVGAESVQGMKSAVEENEQPTISAYENMTKSITTVFDTWVSNTITQFKTDGEKMMTDFGMSLQTYGMAKVSEALRHIKEVSIDSWIATVLPWLDDRGKQAAANFAGGLRFNIGLITTAAIAIGDALKTEINKAIEIIINNIVNIAANAQTLTDMQKFTDLGANMGTALKTGLDSQLEAVKASATALVDAAATSVETAAEIASPSRRFGRLGRYSGEGYAKELVASLNVAKKQVTQFIGELGTLLGGSQFFPNNMDPNYVAPMSQSPKGPLNLVGKDAFAGMSGGISSSLSKQITALAQPRASTSASYSTNSPITINNYINTPMDLAQLQYMMDNTLNRAGLGMR